MKNFFRKLGKILKLLPYAILLAIPFMWLFVQLLEKREGVYWLTGFLLGILGYYLIIGVAYLVFNSLPRLIDLLSE